MTNHWPCGLASSSSTTTLTKKLNHEVHISRRNNHPKPLIGGHIIESSPDSTTIDSVWWLSFGVEGQI